MAARAIATAEQELAAQSLARARAAMRAIEAYDQARVDQLCRAVAWAAGNEQAAIRLANMSVDETDMGSREPSRRSRCSASSGTPCDRKVSVSSRRSRKRAS